MSYLFYLGQGIVSSPYSILKNMGNYILPLIMPRVMSPSSNTFPVTYLINVVLPTLTEPITDTTGLRRLGADIFDLCK